MPLSRLAEIRSGESEPKTGELKNIAKALRRPTTFFFLPAPPIGQDVAVSFRPPAGRSEDRPLNSQEQLALRNSTRWQRIAEWIQEIQNTKISPPPTNPRLSPSQAAQILTAWLSWDLKEQRGAGSSNRLLRILRARLESRGVLVLQYSLGQDSCRGFSIPHRTASLVAVNSAFNASARVYSLMHECAHFIRGDSRVCANPLDDAEERWCEQVAAIFLMPATDLEQYLNNTIKKSKVDDVDDVRRVANRYYVSLRAAAARLSELNRAAPGLYNAVDRLGEFGGGGFNPNVERQTTPVIRLRELGTELPRLLISAGDSGILSDIAVRRYLDVNGPQLDDLKERVAHTAVEV